MKTKSQSENVRFQPGDTVRRTHDSNAPIYKGRIYEVSSIDDNDSEYIYLKGFPSTSYFVGNFELVKRKLNIIEVW